MREIEVIQELISEGMGDSAIAAQVGRHRTSVVKVRTGTATQKRHNRRKASSRVRLTDEEYAAFKSEVDRLGISLSEGGRRLVRHSLGVLEIDVREIDALANVRRELNAIGGDLNQMLKFGKIWRFGSGAVKTTKSFGTSGFEGR